MSDVSFAMQIGLWGLSGLVLVSAVLVVSLDNLFRAALSLGLVLVGVAGFFILLEAEFLAFVQILIYVGAILTLVVFAIMLTAKLYRPVIPQAPRQRLPAALVASVLFVLLVRVIQLLPERLASSTEAISLPVLGRELITTLMLPFEVISLVFVSAMVGAIVVAYTATSTRPSSSTSLPSA